MIKSNQGEAAVRIAGDIANCVRGGAVCMSSPKEGLQVAKEEQRVYIIEPSSNVCCGQELRHFFQFFLP